MPDKEARFRSVVDTTPDMVVIMDDQGVIVSANPAAGLLLGCQSESLVGRLLTDIMPERYRSRHTEGLKRYMATGKRNLSWAGLRLPVLAADGTEIPADISFGEFSEEGRRMFTGIVRDDRDRKKNDDMLVFLGKAGPALASTVLDYEKTLDTVARLAVPYLADWVAIDILERDGSIRRVVMIHDDPARMALVHRIEELYPSDPEAPGGSREIMTTRKSVLFEDLPEGLMEARATDAEHLRMIKALDLRSYVGVPLVAHDRVYGALVMAQAESGRCFSSSDLAFFEDLGRRAALAIHNALAYRASLEDNARLEDQAEEMAAQTAELEVQMNEAQSMAEELEEQSEGLRALAKDLRAKTAEAEEALRAKGDFLAVMSHELRTPLNAIEGYTELLLMGIRGELTVQQVRDLERIKSSSHHLLGLINDVLNYARIDAGKLEYTLLSVPVDVLLADAATMIVPQVERAGLEYSQGTYKGVRVMADTDRTRQILLNLLSNAVRFTPSGGRVTVTCRVEDMVMIDVTDTGPGIDPALLQGVFEPFVQLNRSLSTPGHGTGLGLAISRTLARGMGGDLDAVSVPGEGSTFTLSLPLP